MREHLLFELRDLLGNLLFAHRFEFRFLLFLVGTRLDRLGVVDAVDDVLDALGHALWRDAVLEIECDLLVAPALGLAHRQLHRVGDAVGVQDRGAVDVARGAADGLDEAAPGAQKAFLVGIQNRHQRHLGDVQALAEQVDADQHVEHAQAKVADDLDPLDRVDIRVQVAHLDLVLGQVFGELLGHALR